MTPIFLNTSYSNNYSSYPNDFHHEDHHSNYQILSNNSQDSSLMTNMFLNSNFHDTNGIFGRELHPPQHQHQSDNFGSQAYNHHPIQNSDERGVELSTCDKAEMINDLNNNHNQVKWMSSKMRVMLKWRKSNPINSTTREATKLQDHKPMEETDNSSNTTSSNSNIPIIRVCSDCNTTKTPLWRSGPRGPKSLCNACGIRQRKARRAMAAAAAENGNSNVSRIDDQSIMTPLKVRKTQHKDLNKPSKEYVTKFKKRPDFKKITTNIPPPWPSPSPLPSSSPSPSSSSAARKNCVEEFLESLSKNLSFYGVFPQDEKEAAILLMAISSGYAHET